MSLNQILTFLDKNEFELKQRWGKPQWAAWEHCSGVEIELCVFPKRKEVDEWLLDYYTDEGEHVELKTTDFEEIIEILNEKYGMKTE